MHGAGCAVNCHRFAATLELGVIHLEIRNGAKRDTLNDVLEATKSPDAVDIVVSMARL